MAMQLEPVLADRDRWTAEQCSIDKAISAIGTRSAILLLREAYYGTTRFDAFARRVGVTEAVAAARLKELTELGVLAKQPYREPGQRTRYEYVLTEMGRDLLPVVLGLMQWGDKYLQDDAAPLKVVDTRSGSAVRVRMQNADGEDVAMEDMELAVRR
ncbi:winged helix-turn-helix transcriptional regulator [Catenulispora rubra]|uniref:winged helix-turn-helix transcriptional regulator n=1 Tax=Catenulispora rubra TaxID=280293 RepID=UPI001892445E|nr:helix-turn-helix domain-containing protein [Catenulispora rubra]